MLAAGTLGGGQERAKYVLALREIEQRAWLWVGWLRPEGDGEARRGQVGAAVPQRKPQGSKVGTSCVKDGGRTSASVSERER